MQALGQAGWSSQKLVLLCYGLLAVWDYLLCMGLMCNNAALKGDVY